MNNLSHYCGLVDAKIRATDKDLPARKYIEKNVKTHEVKDSRFHADLCSRLTLNVKCMQGPEGPETDIK